MVRPEPEVAPDSKRPRSKVARGETRAAQGKHLGRVGCEGVEPPRLERDSNPNEVTDMPNKPRTKASDIKTRMPAAIAAVTECAALAQAEATSGPARMTALRIPDDLREAVGAWAVALEEESVGALRVLKELRSAAESGALNAAEVVRVLTEIDARLMSALSRLVDLSGLLEKAAEQDEQCEAAYVFVIEMAARLLHAFKPAQAATRALRDAMGR